MFKFAQGGVTWLPQSGNSVFLTFDDGPDPDVTWSLLKLLDEYQAKATFFVIGERAQRHAAVLKAAVDSGNEVGDHSWDHRYRPFFQSQANLQSWIVRSHSELASLLGRPPVGFRPPAGIITPPLVRALEELGIALIHWNRRFFDTRFRISTAKAMRIANQLQGGEIVLLHDGNARDARALIAGVKTVLEVGKSRGLRFQAIPYSGVRRGW